MNEFDVIVRKPSRALRRKRGRMIYEQRKLDRAALRVAALLAKRLPVASRNQG